jgi:hypothetical protein
MEQRKNARYHVDWRGSCSVNGRHSVDVTIIDCSDGSFGVSGLHAFSQGDSMNLKIDGIGSFPCEVVWVKGERFGAKIIDAWADRELLRLTDYLSG